MVCSRCLYCFCDDGTIIINDIRDGKKKKNHDCTIFRPSVLTSQLEKSQRKKNYQLTIFSFFCHPAYTKEKKIYTL